MIFRILCGIIIVAGFTYGGFMYSERLKNRIKQLCVFQDGLTQLEFNVRYMNLPIAQALSMAGKTCGGAVEKIFTGASDIMLEGVGFSAGEAFCKAIDENRKSLDISENEVEILKSFSKTMGGGDRETEISNIKTALIRLCAAKDQAEEETLRKVKMSRAMGALLGLFIVIVLI